MVNSSSASSIASTNAFQWLATQYNHNNTVFSEIFPSEWLFGANSAKKEQFLGAKSGHLAVKRETFDSRNRFEKLSMDLRGVSLYSHPLVGRFPFRIA